MGIGFSEETELVYLEAVASGDLDASIFDAIVREEKEGYYPSWFGTGFTYNWIKLWTGAVEPFKSNSEAAYSNYATTSKSAFGRPLMGLTACATMSNIDEENFQYWNKYISNQGGSIRGTSGSVIQISPAPYGAALALPFTYEKALFGLREYVAMGYYHEYLGLPDNVRVNSLEGGMTISPNWDPFDINIGPVILAIEQVEDNLIGELFLKDSDVSEALDLLIDSFPD